MFLWGLMDLFEDTYSEKYRHECEIRWIASQPLEIRRKVLGLIGDARGVDVQKRIEAELTILWKNK
jgi:hypothetical protein